MILLVFSLVFYAWGEPKYIFLMIATAFVDYVFGLLIERFRGRWQSKLFLTLAAVITLSSLALFKYSVLNCPPKIVVEDFLIVSAAH